MPINIVFTNKSLEKVPKKTKLKTITKKPMRQTTTLISKITNYNIEDVWLSTKN